MHIKVVTNMFKCKNLNDLQKVFVKVRVRQKRRISDR